MKTNFVSPYERFLLSTIVVLIALMALYLAFHKAPDVQASVSATNEYTGTTTDSSSTAGTRVLRKGRGSLGQVTITGTSTNSSFLTLYDATTSDPTLRAPQFASSSILIAQIPGNTPAGTYTYDALFNYGLILVMTGSAAPTSTITHR